MLSNLVCPYAYGGRYKDAWRWLQESLAPKNLSDSGRRRGVNSTVASLGFTLDYYGARFAREAAVVYAREALPQVRLLDFGNSYPADCDLTAPFDGRHMDRDGDVFYLAKARALMGLLLE